MEKKLKKLKGKRLITVMEDGEAFLGRLKEFDDDTIVLTEVCEGPSSEINWSTLEINTGKESKGSAEKDYGFVDWVCVNLKEVYIRVDHISRIWPWQHIGEYEEPETSKRTPTYSRTPAVDLLVEEEEKEEG